MAIEFNITASDKWFLGEDKILSIEVFETDGITPLDIFEWVGLEFVLRKIDRAPDEIIRKTRANGGIVVSGEFVADETNTQRAVMTFGSDETTDLRAGFPYRYSIKRTDVGNESVLTYGSITFLQATAH
jgi:uncharacterized protein (DUF1684 family)